MPCHTRILADQIMSINHVHFDTIGEIAANVEVHQDVLLEDAIYYTSSKSTIPTAQSVP